LGVGRELAAVELRFHPRNACAAPVEQLARARVAGVIEPVLPFLDTEPSRELRAHFQLLCELGVEESSEPCIICLGGRDRRGLRGDQHGLRDRDDCRGDEQQTQMTHE
jgi:hypothetical protein